MRALNRPRVSIVLSVATAAVLLGCSAENGQDVDPGDSAQSQPSEIADRPNIMGEALGNNARSGQSNCVDATVPNLDKKELFARIVASMEEMYPGESDRAQVDQMREMASKVEADYPWGEIPNDGFADYVTAACDLIPEQYPDPELARSAQSHSGMMLFDATTTCTLWNNEGPRSGSRLEAHKSEAESGKPLARLGLLALQYICPQLK